MLTASTTRLVRPFANGFACPFCSETRRHGHNYRGDFIAVQALAKHIAAAHPAQLKERQP